MTAYYNEIDPHCCAWLLNLIRAGHLAPGEVDERSITEVSADDLRGFTQCHFFAGLGGWSYAMRLAGWPDDRPVWTGSCPCQPFSAAGKQRGTADDRHLWPAWFRLIRECRPDAIFGEQVASAIGHGWLDLVSADLEAEKYAVGAVVLGAHSAGAPHIRQRLWFVADANETGRGLERRGELFNGERPTLGHDADGCGTGSGLGIAARAGLERHRPDQAAQEWAGETRPVAAPGWSGCKWIECADGKTRPTQPGLSPLATGISGRLGRLRAIGNSIVPQVAAEVIQAAMQRWMAQ